MLSPNALSPNGNPEAEPNPFEAEFIGDEEGLDDEEGEGDVDFSTPAPQTEESNFAVLNSSLPGEQGGAGKDGGSEGRGSSSGGPQPHHLASYASARKGGGGVREKEKKQHRTRWHFGIRSRSPPMEVMSAIYASLKSLGMEWKEHVAWFAPISITMVAFVFIRYGRDLKHHRSLRTAVLSFTAASFLAAAIAGFFGAMINKYAPIQGGQTIQLGQGGQK